MNRSLRPHHILILALLIAATGCVTPGRDDAAGGAIPPRGDLNGGANELAMPKSAAAVVKEADEAFRQANASHEDGDMESALRYYTLMLELLIEADLDRSRRLAA